MSGASEGMAIGRSCGTNTRGPSFMRCLCFSICCTTRKLRATACAQRSGWGGSRLQRQGVSGLGGPGRDALEGQGSQRRLQKRSDRRLEEVAKAVGGGYCRLQMPLKLALAIGGQWLGIGWAPSRRRGGGVTSSPSNALLGPGLVVYGWGGGNTGPPSTQAANTVDSSDVSDAAGPEGPRHRAPIWCIGVRASLRATRAAPALSTALSAS